jgi:HAE1 family hydrophobic/amphiphilic exporter-1
MYKQLAYVVSFALACSLAVALTLVPMLAARIFRPANFNQGLKETWMHKIFRISGRIFMHMENSYKQLLHLALDHRKLCVFGAILLFAGSLALIPYVGVEYMPNTDEGEVRINAEMAVGTRLGLADEAFKTIEDVVKREVPEAKSTLSRIGGTSWRSRGSHTGRLRISLKPESERSRSSEEIAAALRPKLRHIPGITIRTRAGQGLFILRMGTTNVDKVQVEIRGHDLKTADALSWRVKEIVEEVDGVTDAKISRESGTPEELIIIDRQKAADMKLTVSQIANMLQTVMSGTSAGNYREAGDEYRILVKLKDADQVPLRDILDLTLTNAKGEQVVLRNVVKLQPRTGPVLIERKDQERIITVSANISGRDMGSILNDIRNGLRSVPEPRDFSIAFGGDYEEQQKAFHELLLSFVLALVLVYMVMASLYESLRDPFVVMFSVPLAVIGVILMLLLTNTTFNVQSFIGCIMLGGIVVNNAILLVDQINLLRRRDGMPLQEAIEEAGRGEAQAPMARAVIGGLLSSTLITLIFVPTVYSFFKSKSGTKK